MSKQLKVFLVMIAYVSLAHAKGEITQVTLWDDLSRVEILQSFIIALAASNIGGIVRTSSKLKSPRSHVRSLWIELVSDQIGACFAGAVAFLICEAYDFGSFAEVAVIMLAAYAGSAMTDEVSKTAVKAVPVFFRRLFGIEKDELQ